MKTTSTDGTATPVRADDLYLSGLKRLFGADMLENAAPGFDAAVDWLRSLTDSAGADGISLEAGREAFDLLLRELGGEIGLLNSEIRMLPMRSRAKKGFEALAEWFKAAWGWESAVNADASTLKFQLRSIGYGGKAHLQSPFCFFVEGLLQGLLFWASGGKYYEPRSMTPAGSSDLVCEFAFSRMPID